MDKRTVLAFVLMALVIVVVPRLFPSTKQVEPPTPAGDSAQSARDAAQVSAPAPGAAATPPAPTATATRAPATIPTAPRAETTLVTTASTRYALVSPGATPSAVQLNAFRDLRPGARDTMVMRQPAGALLHYRLALGADTVSLDTLPLTVTRAGSTVTFSATKPAVSLTYTIPRDGYLATVRGTVSGAPANSALLVDLPQTLRSAEADTTDDIRHLAYGYKPRQRDVQSVPFAKLDTLATRVDTGAMLWASARTKYFLVAVTQPGQGA